MINYNGKITTDSFVPLHQNRAFLYGDSVFETLKIVDGKVLFLEDHYFRLMASMRIVRMEIPMYFTMDYMEQQVADLVNEMNLATSSRVRISFFRNSGGYYLPTDNNSQFIITAEPLEQALYILNDVDYEVDIFKDYYVSKQLLSTIKSINKMVQITGSIYADENGLNNCLLLNEDKHIVEALQGNIFMLNGTKLITPPVSDGCLNGIMRKQVLAITSKLPNIVVSEESISPFDLQKADELFITNVIKGIQPIKKYRKKEYSSVLSKELVKRLNAMIRLG